MSIALLPLSLAENDDLAACEAAIQGGLQTFMEVGAALLKIRDGTLYRSSHGTFEDYCRDRWNIARRTAYQLMEAAEVVENVRHGAQTVPENERQARPLTSLDPDQQSEAWSRAVETAPNGKPTAAHVSATVDEMYPRREALVLPPWTASEKERKKDALGGKSVLANQRFDHRLIAWAKTENRYVPIDRHSYPIGNPMKIGDPDPDRAAVIAWYRDNWLPYVEKLVDWDSLSGGKVLGCWCYPELCHGDVILTELTHLESDVP